MKSLQNINVKESVVIFLYIRRHNATQRIVMKIFGHSQKKHIQKFHEILNVIEFMVMYMFKPHPINLIKLNQNCS